jgi:hypothetical protein
MAEEKDEALPITPRKKVSEADSQIARSGPAIYSNRVIVTNEAVVRITFVEQYKETAFFRTAVALPHQTAIELANVLKTMLAEIEADLERFKAEEEAKARAEHG